MKDRNNMIEFLRFLAAFSVCLFHFNEPIPYVDNWYRNLCKYGWLGVPVFFVISGYCIARSASNSKSVTAFFVKRFFRIFPPYWVNLVLILVIVLVCVVITGQNSIAVLPKDWESISLTIALLTSPFSNVGCINWVYWSLTFELFFYGIIFISLLLPKKAASAFIMIVSLATFIYPYVSNINFLFFLRDWAAFGIGISLFYFIKTDKKTYLISFVIFGINLTSIVYFKGFDGYVIMVLVTGLLIGVSLWVKDLPEGFFSNMGDYSYSVYLLHVPIGVYLLGNLKKASVQDHVILNITFDIVTYIFVAIMAYFSYLWIELPFIRQGRSLAKNIAQRRIFIFYK